jgi:predicted flap endonuclease-1-like 5' DNA nuclease
MTHTATRTPGPPVGLGPGPTPVQPLALSKLRGLTLPVRAALKRRGIATCERLLRAAGRAGDRDRLAREAGVDPGELLALVRRADLARVDGIGTVFGLMLEELGVHDVPVLAAQGPADLHARLRRHNEEERIARRAPTPEEVERWVAQARSLPALVSY